MRPQLVLHTLVLGALATPALLFWRRGAGDLEREQLFNELYDVLANVYEAAANLKPHWQETWSERQLMRLPPKFEQNEVLPVRTIDAVREMRFARQLLQRNRWRSVREPLFENVDPIAWAAMQRRLHMVSAELVALEDANREYIREDEITWIDRAVEGFDRARSYLRSAERAGEPLERQVANCTYLAVHQCVQLSDRLIERQRFELSADD